MIDGHTRNNKLDKIPDWQAYVKINLRINLSVALCKWRLVKLQNQHRQARKSDLMRYNKN